MIGEKKGVKVKSVKVKSATGKIVRVASTTGHIILIGEKFVSIPEAMMHDALTCGCITEEMFDRIVNSKKEQEENGELTEEERQEKVNFSIVNLLTEKDPDKFTDRGLPKAEAVNAICGFTSTKEERETALEAYDG